MISTLGRGLVMASLLFATVGCLTGFVAGYRHNMKAYAWTRTSAYGFAASMIAANFLMLYALLTHDFSVAYVAEVGSLDTPVYFTIVSLWASLNGSILFWGGILGLYVGGMVWAVGDRHREYMPWTMHVLMGVSVFFAFLVASIANPFAPVFPVPLDGPGPNPLLQNHWLMAFHPPTLYLGYVGMSVPFSMLCAALLAGRLESGWMAPVRRWMLIPWMFLTVGIVLGGWWSYAVLGWGGTWAWDPVENASFHPWLTGTAFLHSAMVLQRRGRMRDWTLVLGMSTFLLTLVGTFMTRSGVFNSVHSFTQSDIGPVFLVFIAIVLVYSVVLLATRSHTLDEASKSAERDLGARSTRGAGSAWDRLASREFAILVQNALFTVFTFTVLLGTLYPLIAEAVQSRRVSVGEPYFDKWALPLGLGLVFLMGVGPALPWGRLSLGQVPRRLGPAAAVGIAFAALAAALGFSKPMTVLTLFVCGFALATNMAEIIGPTRARMKAHAESLPVALNRVIRRARRRFGGHVAHYGVLIAVVSIALTKGYRNEADYTLAQGQTAEHQGYGITYTGAQNITEPHRSARLATFAVTKDGRDLGTYSPRMNIYPTRREPIYSPAVYSQLHGDLYLSILDVPPDGARATVRVIWEPFQVWLWIAPVVISLGTIITIWPARRRRRAAAPGGAREEAA